MADSSGTSNGALNIAQLATALAPIFLGAGTKTTTQQPVTTTNSINPATLAGLTGIANTAQGNATNPAITQNLVNNILTESAQAFAPVIAQQSSAGLYKSSTLATLADESQARATAAASQAVLNYQTSQQQIATQALTSIANDTKTTTQGPVVSTVAQNPTIPLLTSAATLAGGVIGNKLLSSDAAASVGNAITNPISDAFSSLINSAPSGVGGFSGAGGGVSALTGATTGPFAANFPAVSAPSLAAINAPGDAIVISGAGDTLGGVGIGAAADTAATGAAGDAVLGGIAGSDGIAALTGGGVAADSAGLAALTGAGDAGAAAGGFTAAAGADAAAGAGAAAAGADAGGGFLSFLAPVLAATVVCTTLFRQGIISKELYKTVALYGSRYHWRTREAYWFWGIPLASFLWYNQSSFLAKFITRIFRLQYEYVGYFHGMQKYKFKWEGYFWFMVFHFLTWFLVGVFFITKKRVTAPRGMKVA